jgi:hypothetical protein
MFGCSDFDWQMVNGKCQTSTVNNARTLAGLRTEHEKASHDQKRKIHSAAVVRRINGAFTMVVQSHLRSLTRPLQITRGYPSVGWCRGSIENISSIVLLIELSGVGVGQSCGQKGGAGYGKAFAKHIFGDAGAIGVLEGCRYSYKLRARETKWEITLPVDGQLSVVECST